MKMNKSGEGGFMESMIALIIVIISLTAFLSLLAFSFSHDTGGEIEMPLNVLDDVRIVNGNIEADIDEKMATALETHGLAGMRVVLSVSDGIYHSEVTFNAGRRDGDLIHTRTGTIMIRSDDGRCVPVGYIMAVWP
jgi:hypothetical protein